MIYSFKNSVETTFSPAIARATATFPTLLNSSGTRYSPTSAVTQRDELKRLIRPSDSLIGLQVTEMRRQGSVFYLDVKYGNTKGSVAADSDMINSKTGHNRTQAGRRYATEYITDETIGASGDTIYSGSLAYNSIIAGSVVITDGVETFTDNGLGVLVTDLSTGSNGTITSAGVYAVTFATTTAAAVTADYQYNSEKATNGVSEVNVSMSSTAISAIDFKLKALYQLKLGCFTQECELKIAA
jgi:predicted RecA/RadA family phage recombinase